ncbi:MAG: thioredoxin family protein [Anaerolineae bacterium]
MRTRITERNNAVLGVLLAVLAIGLIAGVARPAEAHETEEGSIPIYFFWGDGCPHCAEEEPFLDDLAVRYPGVVIEDFEVWYDNGNRELFTAMASAFGTEPGGVPTTFIGDRYWVGFSDAIGAEIEAYVAANIEVGVRDAGADIIPGHGGDGANEVTPEPQTGNSLRLPLLGEINLAGQSLTLSTAIIAFIDGFNPCSLWVLSILLAMTLHTGSRRQVLIVGTVFLAVTALVYALFIAGLFTIFTFVSFVGWIQVVVALIALFFAAVNIKDYFFYKEGLSFTISDEKKPGLYRNIRRVMDAGDSLWGLVGATVVMAAGVSLVEFSCTAGFPVMWTNLLAAQNVTPLAFGLLLLLYMVIYQIDELAIFLTATFTLKSSRLEEKHGRILKLIGGMLMLTLALVMLIKPSLMSSVSSSLTIFAVAFAVTPLTLVVHRKVLPHYGIHIGTEDLKRKRKRRRASTKRRH